VHFHDAPAHHLFDAEVVAMPHHVVAFPQEFPGLTQQESGKRDVLAGFGDFQRQLFV